MTADNALPSRPARVPASSIACATLLAAAVFGFWLPYFSKLGAADRFTHFHVATMLHWMLLLITQPLLICTGRRDLHRAFGRASLVLVPLIILSSLLLAHARISAAGALDQPGMLQLLVLQFMAPILFAGFYLAARRNRRSLPVHSRWMLSTGFLLIDPIVARIIGFWMPQWSDAGEWAGPLLAGLTLLVLIVAERRATAGRHVFPLVLGWLVVQLILFYTLGASSIWRVFAQWFAALPLT
ncbi:MAG: hypothetical protein JNM76_10375 [Betaproteobacteria bacterium]|nr:hypothetical protein [Betaproteobacteria bacterium]